MSRLFSCFEHGDIEPIALLPPPNSRSTTKLRRKLKWLLFSHESMNGLAEKVKDILGDGADLAGLEWNHFNDRFPSLQIDDALAQKLHRFDGVCFIMSLHSPEVIFEQMALLYALPRMGVQNYRVILPFFPTGTNEHAMKLGQIVTAGTLCHILSDTPKGISGPSTFLTYDIHAMQENFYFTDSVIVVSKSAFGLLKGMIHALRRQSAEEIAIAFPRHNVFKRFKDQFLGVPLIYCGTKAKDGSYTIKKGSPEGSHVIVADVQVRSGNTLFETIKAIKAGGASKVSVFCVHGTFRGQSWKKFQGDGFVHKFWITDSVPPSCEEIMGQEPFEVLSIAPLIARYLEAASGSGDPNDLL